MKNRKAALQQKLDGAIKSYREHVSTDPSADNEAAHIARTAELKNAMDRASEALQAEKSALAAEALLVPEREGADRDASITGGEDRSRLDPTGGFRSMGEFSSAIIAAGSRSGRQAVDSRLIIDAAAPTTYGNESLGADGGYLVPPEYANRIMSHAEDEGSLLSLCDELPISGNTMSFPKDETTPWGTDGIRMRWAVEAAAAGQDKPKLGETNMKLRKMIGLVPLTDELAADAAASGAYVSKKLSSSLAWKINEAIISGNGAQIPLGIRNSGAIITQAAEGAQTADTINATNVSKMLGRLTQSALKSSSLRWIIQNDAFHQLMLMTIGNQPIWTPPTSGFKDAPMGFLLGRPVIVSQLAQTLGDLGDILLVDLKQYITISKGPQFAESMHLFFDADAMAFRLTFRMDGQPWLSAPVSPANGSNTLSAFVQLAAR